MDKKNQKICTRKFRARGTDRGLLIGMWLDTGLTFTFQALPFVVVAVLSFAVIGLREFIKRKEVELWSSLSAEGKSALAPSSPYLREWQWSTYPLWIDGRVFGILTAAEVVGILGILFLISYNFGRTVHLSFGRIDDGTATQHHHHGSSLPSK